MTQYLLPTNSEFVNDIARAIARDRLMRDAIETLQTMTGNSIAETEEITASLDYVFDRLWAGCEAADMKQKASYAADALAAINAINLKLLIST
jgi:hypothetical protein